MSKDTSVLLEETRVFKPHYTIVEEAHIKNWEAELEKGKDHEKYGPKRRKDSNGSGNGTRYLTRATSHSTSGS